jgi:hypothetical protein
MEDCQHRPVQYLNNVLEHDHRAIKRRVRASQRLPFLLGSLAHDRRLRNDPHDPQRSSQACESAPGGIGILLHRFILAQIFGSTTNLQHFRLYRLACMNFRFSYLMSYEDHSHHAHQK